VGGQTLGTPDKSLDLTCLESQPAVGVCVGKGAARRPLPFKYKAWSRGKSGKPTEKTLQTTEKINKLA